MYKTISANVAAAIARGKTRCGSRVSPAENVTYCQPSYAPSTPIIAAAAPVKTELVARGGQAAADPCAPPPHEISAPPISSRPHTLAAVVQFSSIALCRVPRTFTAAIAMIISTDRIRAAAGPTGRSWPRYPATATASLAIEPLAITRTLLHSETNAGRDPKRSRMSAYNQPAAGFNAGVA